MTIFALPLISPPRENRPTFCSVASSHFFLESPSPQASHNTHLHDSHAVAMVLNFNIYEMFACLKYGYRCFSKASGLVLTFLLCCYAPGCHALLVASIPLYAYAC